jgi:hypothetical protein
MLYSFTNIINASVLIPAKMTKSMVTSYLALIGGTGVFFYLTHVYLGVLGSMAWGMAFGAIISLVCMLYFIKRAIKFSFFNIDHVAILLAGFAVSMLCPIGTTWLKALAFFVLAPMLIWSVFIPSFLGKEDLSFAFLGTKAVFNRFKKVKREEDQ